MGNIQLLIKPSSGNCNLRCKYCFYADITENRQTPSFGFMSFNTLEAIVKRVIENSDSECGFAFQGGEPTLVGLDFYYKLIEFEKRYNTRGIKIHNSIQTNGYCIDEKWAEFLASNNFLVGLSMDGNKDIHDLYRVDASGDGTFKKILRTVQIFDKYKVEYNILTVVTAQSARSIAKIYGFYRKNNLCYQQYIPCLDPLGEKRGNHQYSLTPELYSNFLKDLFDLWYKDIISNKFIYNRYFENLVGMLKGYPPESCGMLGKCACHYVVEADGGVYPCDFYVLDEYKIGNLANDSFKTIQENLAKLDFIEKSMYIDEKCKSCKWINLCRGGCRRDREPIVNGHLSLNYFCASYENFFEYSIERLQALAKGI